MNTKYLLICFSILVLAAFSTLSFEKQYTTVESCVELLPEGYEFTLSIDATINTKSSKNTLTGELNITDGTTVKKPELGKQTESFKQCVLKLIK